MLSDEIALLKNQNLFRGFTDEELAKIRPILSKEEYQSNDMIIEEGDLSTELYMIAKGEVSILKWDTEHKFQLPINRLTSGQMFGEMSFIDSSPRSSSIKAIKETIVWKLSREDLNKRLPEMADIHGKVITNIALINIQRLRESNKSYVKNLRSEVADLQRRAEKGQFTMALIILLGVFLMGTLLVKKWFPQLPINTIDLVSWLVLFPCASLLIKNYHYNFEHFGITPRYWLNVITYGILIGIIGVAIFKLIHWSYIRLHPNEVFNETSKIPFIIWVGPYLLYCFAKEFLTRGVLQTSIRDFLNDKSGWRSVFTSAAIVTLFQIPIVAEFGLVTFIANLIFGFIYLRQQNILGVTAIHFIWGIFFRYIGINFY